MQSGTMKYLCYNGNDHSTWVDEKEIMAKWDGAGLVIEKPNKMDNIEFDSLIHDMGMISSADFNNSKTSVETFIYTFRNNGRSAVEVKKLQYACQCLAASHTKGAVAPGAVGTISMTYDLTRNKGVMRQVALARIFDSDANTTKSYLLNVMGDVKIDTYFAPARYVAEKAYCNTVIESTVYIVGLKEENFNARSIAKIDFDGTLKDNIIVDKIEDVSLNKYLHDTIGISLYGSAAEHLAIGNNQALYPKYRIKTDRNALNLVSLDIRIKVPPIANVYEGTIIAELRNDARKYIMLPYLIKARNSGK